MYYKQILSTPAASLRDMTYATFAEMFKSTNEELEMLEAAQDREKDKYRFIQRESTINQLNHAKDNLTMHRHYASFCDAQDRKHWDSVYHRPLYG